MGSPVLTDADISKYDSQQAKPLTDADVSHFDQHGNLPGKSVFPEVTKDMWEQHPVLSAIAQTGQDAATIPANYFNQFLNNTPRALFNRMGVQYPSETSNPVAQFVNKAAGVGGAVESPINAAIMGMNGLGTLGKGMAIGASYAPTQANGIVNDLQQRVNQSMVGGLLSKVPDVINSGKTLMDKLSNNYVSSVLVPKVEGMYNDAVNKFTQPIQDLAKGKYFNIDPDIVSHIAQQTPAKIEASANAMNNSPAKVQDIITSGMADKGAQVGKAYDAAWGSVPDNTYLALPKTFKATNNFLQGNKIIDNVGNLTEYGKQALKNDQSLSGVYGNYLMMKSESGVGTTIAQRNNIAPVNQAQWNVLRNNFSKASNSANYSTPITRLLDNLHADAVDAGIPIQQARELAKQHFDMQELANPYLVPGGENKLSNIFKQPQDTLENLSSLDKYLGTNAQGYAKDIAANQALQAIKNKPTAAGFLVDSPLQTQIENISHITQAGKAGKLKSNLESLLGKSNDLNQVFNDLRLKRYQGVIGGALTTAAGATAYGFLHGLADKAKDAVDIPE